MDHLPGIDLDPALLAEKTYEFYKTYDVDFIKTMNNGMYQLKISDARLTIRKLPKEGLPK